MATPYIVIGCPTTGGGQVITETVAFSLKEFRLPVWEIRQRALSIKRLLPFLLAIQICR
jgi:hypothetical protein